MKSDSSLHTVSLRMQKFKWVSIVWSIGVLMVWMCLLIAITLTTSSSTAEIIAILIFVVTKLALGVSWRMKDEKTGRHDSCLPVFSSFILQADVEDRIFCVWTTSGILYKVFHDRSLRIKTSNMQYDMSYLTFRRSPF